MVAQLRHVGVSRAVAEALRRRVVLDDEVVPVGEPDGAVRSDLGVDGRDPLFGPGREVPSVARDESRALLFHDALTDQVRRRLVDERDAVPVLPRERPRRIEIMTGARRVAVEHVHLADVWRQRMHGVERGEALVTGADPALSGRRQSFDALEEAVRDSHVEARVVVRCRSEHVERLAEAEPPGVVGRARHHFEVAAVGLEAEGRLGELRTACR